MSHDEKSGRVQVVFGKDAYLDCWNSLRTLSMKQQLGVFMTLEQQGKAVGTPDEVTALREALVKRRETLVSRMWWKLYKDTVDATAYVPDAEDLEDIRCTIFAELAVILDAHLDTAGKRSRPQGFHSGFEPTVLFAWVEDKYAGKKTDAIETLEIQMKELSMLDFVNVTAYMQAHRQLWLMIQSLDPGYDEQRALRCLVNPLRLDAPFKGQGDFFASALRAGQPQKYEIIYEAMLRTAVDNGLETNDVVLTGKKKSKSQVQKLTPEEKDSAFVVSSKDEEIASLRLQLALVRSELALAVVPAQEMHRPKCPVCWNKWCKKVGHRRQDCTTPKPPGWKDDERREHGHVVKAVEVVCSEECIEALHTSMATPKSSDATAYLVLGEDSNVITVDGAATSHVVTMSQRDHFASFTPVSNQVLKTAGGDVEIIGRASMEVTLLDGTELTLRDVAVVQEGHLLLLSVGAWLIEQGGKRNGDAIVHEVAYLQEKVLFREGAKTIMQGVKGRDKLYGMGFRPAPTTGGEKVTPKKIPTKNFLHKNLNFKDAAHAAESAKSSGSVAQAEASSGTDDAEELDRQALFYGDLQQTLKLLHLCTNHGGVGRDADAHPSGCGGDAGSQAQGHPRIEGTCSV